MAAIATGWVGAAPSRFAVDSSGKIYIVNGIDAPSVWDGVAAAFRNWGIAPPPTLSLGALSGTGLTGTYFWKVTWYNENSGEYGEASNSVTATLTDDGQTVNRPSTAGIDSQITHWRLWRTTAGQASTYYLVTTQTTATASYVDNNADEVVGSNEVLDDPNRGSTGRLRPEGKYPYVRQYKGRLVLYGSRIESTGTVTLTNGATSVAGAGTNFRASHVGARIYAGTDTAFYTIATVTNATTATLTANYGGTTAGGKTFRLVAARPSDVAWSAGGSEGFVVGSSAGVFPADGDFPTGMEVIGTSLILFKRAHAYLFDYGSDPDPVLGTGNISMVLSNRGLIRQECCVPVGQHAYCLDSQGIYQFDGSSQEVPIDQAIRRFFQTDDSIPTEFRVNRAYSHTWHGTYDQKTDSVFFFVTCGSETTPKTVLVFNRERQRWLVHRFNQGVTASCIGQDAAGEMRAWVGDENEWVWALAGTRQCEGNSTGTLEGTATAAAAGTLTDGGATFPTAGNALAGVYVTIRSGTGAGQSRLITSNTGTVLTITPNWSPTPDTTSGYVIGAVESKWRYVWNYFALKGAQSKSLIVRFEPNASGREIQFRIFKDFESNPVRELRVSRAKDGLTIPSTVSTDGWCTIDASHEIGRVEITPYVNAKTCFSLEFREFSANEPVLFIGYDMEGVENPQEFE